MATDNAVTAVSTADSTATAMFTLVWQRCAHHCQSSGNWQPPSQHYQLPSYRCHTNVHIVISALSLPLLFQRCVSNRCGIPPWCRTKTLVKLKIPIKNWSHQVTPECVQWSDTVLFRGKLACAFCGVKLGKISALILHTIKTWPIINFKLNF